MVRPSRFVLGAVLVIGAACSGGTPTAPTPAPNTMAPDPGALMDEDPDCRGGFSVANGKAC
jgi:hypothetical protein